VHLRLVEEAAGDARILTVHGRIDSNTAKEFGERLNGLLEAGPPCVVVDLGHLLYISSAGFRMLLIAARLADSRGARLALCAMSPDVRRLFDLGRFSQLFPIFASRDEAVAQPG
jgi:anti-sigma B factor antagonist